MRMTFSYVLNKSQSTSSYVFSLVDRVSWMCELKQSRSRQDIVLIAIRLHKLIVDDGIYTVCLVMIKWVFKFHPIDNSSFK